MKRKFDRDLDRSREIYFLTPFAHLGVEKKPIVDCACQERGMRSFANLEAVWNVDAGYTFDAIDRHNVDRAVIVDTGVTPAVLERQKKYRHLEIIVGNFDQSVLGFLARIREQVR
jgi:hypothetical protein